MNGARRTRRQFVLAVGGSAAEHRRPMPRRVPLPALLVWLLATACATTVAPLRTAEQSLVDADARLQAGDPDGALDALAPIEGDQCPKRLGDRRDILTAEAELARGELWRAYLALEKFSDVHPHSELRQKAVEMLWQIGRGLIERDGGFLFFWSDRGAGRTVLEHLITRHPDTQHLADALRILGDMAFEDENYELAQQRFRDIILNQPESEWRVYAQFRFAMSMVASLQGPDYDLDRTEHAARELNTFLATQPENPELLAETERALATLRQWQVERHLTIADFYRRVDNVPGQRYHLELATRPEFADVPAYARAVAERDALLRALPPAGGAGGGP